MNNSKFLTKSYEELKNILINSKQTDDLCRDILSHNGILIQFVKNKTPDLCDLAVNDCAWAILHVPEKFQTEEMWKKAVKKDHLIFDHCPYQSEDICMIALKANGAHLKNIKNITKQMCLVAVNNNGYSLKYVPEKLKTEDVIKKAIYQESYAIEFVDKPSEELCDMAVSRHYSSIKHIENQTEAIVLKAINQCGDALEFVKNQTEKVCIAAINKKGTALKHVKKQTAKICLLAIKKNPRLSRYVKMNGVNPRKMKLEEILEILNKQSLKDKIIEIND